MILFIPGDQFLSRRARRAARRCSTTRIRQNVIIATPTSFVALLKAVAYGWRQTALAQNAETIRTLAEELYKRLGVVHRPPRQARPNLGDSVEAFNSAVGSLERRCCRARASSPSSACGPSARSKSLDPVDKLAREPQWSED